jgi:hypothetical protein
MTYLLLGVGIIVPLIVFAVLFWLFRSLADVDPAQDTLSSSYRPKSRNPLRWIRAWLLASPKTLSYRRDKRGRFRRVRRG